MALNRRAVFLIFGFLFVLFLLGSRFLLLGNKPYHHDESLYATEAWRYATQGIYKFNPMLHGPFLFHLHAALFQILPINDFTGRLPMAMLACLTVLCALPLFLKRSLGSAIAWIIVVAASPTLCYFARFLGMDTLMAFLGVALLISALKLRETESVGWLYVVIFILACMVCTKLNFLFYVFSFLTFLPLWAQWNGEKLSNLVRPFIPKTGRHWFSAFGIFALVFCAFYSSLGRNMGGILDGLGRTMIPYWVNQHRMERVGGPFHYYVPLLATYELPLLIGIVISAIHIVRASRRERTTLIWACAGAALLYFLGRMVWPSIGVTVGKVTHLKEFWHPALAVLLLGLWLALVRGHLSKGEVAPAFFLHWGMTSLFIYSYAGEKVPWLMVHIVLPFCFYVAWLLPSWIEAAWNRRWLQLPVVVLLTVTVLWQGFITLRASFWMGADPRERLVYTHTSYDIRDLVKRIDHIATVSADDKRLGIQVTGNAVWPLQWYLRDYKQWYWVTIEPSRHPRIVIHDWEQKDTLQIALGPNYTAERRKLREWWVPDDSQGSFKKYVRYYFTRETYSPIGSTDIVVFVDKEVLKDY